MLELGTEQRMKLLRGHPELWGRRMAVRGDSVCVGARREWRSVQREQRRGRVKLNVFFGASDSPFRGL